MGPIKNPRAHAPDQAPGAGGGVFGPAIQPFSHARGPNWPPAARRPGPRGFFAPPTPGFLREFPDFRPPIGLRAPLRPARGPFFGPGRAGFENSPFFGAHFQALFPQPRQWAPGAWCSGLYFQYYICHFHSPNFHFHNFSWLGLHLNSHNLNSRIYK